METYTKECSIEGFISGVTRSYLTAVLDPKREGLYIASHHLEFADEKPQKHSWAYGKKNQALIKATFGIK
jgi:hypothetical protein